MKPSMMLDSLWVLASRFLMRATNLVVFLVLARGLSQAEFGQYGYVMASLLMLSVIFDLGLRQSTGVHVGGSEHDGPRVLGQLLLLWCVLAVPACVAMLVVLRLGGQAEPYWALIVASLSLAPALLIRMGQGAFLGLGRMKELNQSEVASRAFLLLSTLALWLTGTLTIVSALSALLGSYLAAALWLLLQIRGEVRLGRPDLAILRDLLGTGMIFAGGIVAMILLGRVGIWIVNAQLGTEDVGAYFAVMRLSEMIAEVATAVGVVIFSHGVRTGDARQAALATVRTTRGVTAIMALAGAAAALMAAPVLRLSVGEAYVGEVDAFRILVLGAVMSCYGMMLYPGLSSQGGAHWGLKVFGPGTVLAAGLCWFLASRYGVLGAAAAFAISQAAVAIAFMFLYRNLHGIPLHRIALPQAEDLDGVRRLAARILSRPQRA